jgi:hypothetical protein
MKLRGDNFWKCFVGSLEFWALLSSVEMKTLSQRPWILCLFSRNTEAVYAG